MEIREIKLDKSQVVRSKNNNSNSIQFIRDLVVGCNCEGYVYERFQNIFVIVLHPHNSLEDAKYCMTKLEESRSIIVQYDYNVRLTESAYKSCLARDKQYHENIILLG